MFDRLSQAPDAKSEPARTEPIAMAAIHNVDADRASETWRDLGGVLATSPAPDTAPLATAGTPEPMTVLVVEDDPETAADLTEALTEAGHDVVGPFQVAEAAEAAAALHQIDVALLDINLSGETDGSTLARSLKDRWGTPVIFLSGDVEAASRHVGLADAMVLKPYTTRDVLTALGRLQALKQRRPD